MGNARLRQGSDILVTRRPDRVSRVAGDRCPHPASALVRRHAFVALATTAFVLGNLLCAWASIAADLQHRYPARLAIVGKPPRLVRDKNPFVPVGVNYFHLHQGAPYASFDTFDPGVFDARESDHVLAAIRASGFNYVRIWLSGYYPDNQTIRQTLFAPNGYAHNLVLFLQQARSHGLFVVLTGYFRPGQYLPRAYLPADPAAGKLSMNDLLLNDVLRTGLAAFYVDLLTSIAHADQSLLGQIFYFDLYNELHFDLEQPPFTNSAVFSYSGRTYNLDRPAERQSLMEQAASDWVAYLVHAVRSVDSQLLIAVSSFPNSIFGHNGFDGTRAGGLRPAGTPDLYPLRPRSLIKGGVSLLDIHLYPYPAAAGGNGNPALSDDLDRVLLSGEVTRQTADRIPLIIGELGALKAQFSTPAASVVELRQTLAGLCSYRISGWGFWMWDGPGTTWTLQDAGGLLNEALSPNAAGPLCKGQPSPLHDRQ